jgi:GntR family transcriptional regulator
MTTTVPIDRDSYVPFYVQVKESLRDLIESGGLGPGAQLPGEPELCRLFDVSRTVIRQALRDLELQGLIRREKGRGTFVAEPKVREALVQHLTGFHEDMTRMGRPPISRVLAQEVMPAGGKVAELLRLEPGEHVVYMNRLRFVDDEPLVLVATYLPATRCPGLESVDFTHRSLYAYLDSTYGLVIDRGRRVLEAVPAGVYEAGLLGVKRGAPLIQLESISFLADGAPIEYYHALHRGDRSRFEVELIKVPMEKRRLGDCETGDWRLY